MQNPLALKTVKIKEKDYPIKFAKIAIDHMSNTIGFETIIDLMKTAQDLKIADTPNFVLAGLMNGAFISDFELDVTFTDVDYALNRDFTLATKAFEIFAFDMAPDVAEEVLGNLENEAPKKGKKQETGKV